MDSRNNRFTEMLLLMCFCLSSLAMEAQKAPHERDFPTRREARRMMKLIKRADHQEDYVRQWYKRQKREPPKDWGKEVKRKDENHRFEYLTDKDFNDNARGCYMVDGVYIGPYDIGINCCSTKKREIRIGHGKPFTIRGIGAHNDSITINMPDSLPSGKGQTPAIRNRDFWYVINYEDQDNKTFLVTLDEVKKALYPNLKEPILFMINKFFITHDEDLYRIDRNFIMKVELLNSSDISALKLFPTFSIIRIFTWTPHNWHQAQGYETSQTE